MVLSPCPATPHACCRAQPRSAHRPALGRQERASAMPELPSVGVSRKPLPDTGFSGPDSRLPPWTSQPAWEELLPGGGQCLVVTSLRSRVRARSFGDASTLGASSAVALCARTGHGT